MSRSLFSLNRSLLSFLMIIFLLGSSGCRTIQNRDWPAFWRTKPIAPIYLDTDYIINPAGDDMPPPVLLGQGDLPENIELSIPQTDRPELDSANLQGAEVISELQTVTFEYNSYALSPRMEQQLANNVAWIQSHPGITIQIEGHCDERGSSEYNMNLGQRRADTVREHLYKLGVDPSLLTTISWGEERPLDPGNNEDSWAKNRRAQFLIY